MRFEWDPQKATDNFKKHEVAFSDAQTVFADPFALTFDDPDHSIDERRFLTIGTTVGGRVLIVAHADIDDSTIRLISARRANPRERHVYERPGKE